MKIIGIIPARYASTRFPGKPLIMIDGKAMIMRVYEQVLKCRSLDKVIIATDHEAIQKHVASFGAGVMMTSEIHRSGTERCAEVVKTLENMGENFDVIVNIQGDEPFIEPAQIEQLVSCFSDPEIQIGTLAKKITSKKDLINPNLVKVVRGSTGLALYFSRAAIPYVRGKNQESWLDGTTYFKHIGIYGFRTGILKKIVGLNPSPLESAESLEQLRWLEHGFPIYIRETEFESIGIDSPADLLKITNRN